MSPKQNQLLASLSAEDYFRLLPDLEPVSCVPGQVLGGPGELMPYAYFPTTCVVSLLATGSDGVSVAVAVAGNDGMVGVTGLLGGELLPQLALVQGAGEAYRMRAELVHWELDQRGGLLPLGLRYAQVLMAQMAQTALCNRHHTVEKQLCRWLLLLLDYSPAPMLTLTQAALANLLGVRREAVVAAAGKLQSAGLIRYSRGRITVLDRPALERQVCECYAVIRKEGARLAQPLASVSGRHRVRANLASVRKRAEERFRQSRFTLPNAPEDKDRLLEELQVHLIVMEMQHEELAQSYAEADMLRDRYADIYDFSPIAYVTVNELGAIRQINLAGAILLGLRRSQITRFRFSASLSEDSRPAFTSFLGAVLGGDGRGHCELELAATAQRPAVIVAVDGVADDAGRECRMVLVDVTEERLARARERLLNSALLAVGNGVVITDLDGRIQWVNPAFEALTGYVGKEALDLRPADLLKSGLQSKAYYVAMWQTILAGGVWRGELVNRRKDGSLYRAELTIAPVRDEVGAISHFVGIQEDIGHRGKLAAAPARLDH